MTSLQPAISFQRNNDRHYRHQSLDIFVKIFVFTGNKVKTYTLIMTHITFSMLRCQFSPGLASSLITLCLVPLFCTLGTWQLQRFEYKKHQQKNVALSENRLQMSGQFLNQKSILLDNQIYKGQAGYQVFTPFIEDTHNIQDNINQMILVDRGWIPQGIDRSILPSIPRIEGSVTLQGHRTKPPSPGLKWWSRSQDIKHDGPQRVLGLDFERLATELGYPLAPFILELESGNPIAFVYPPKTSGTAAIKHLGYAFQWFMMALAVLIYYLLINTKRIMQR